MNWNKCSYFRCYLSQSRIEASNVKRNFLWKNEIYENWKSLSPSKDINVLTGGIESHALTRHFPQLKIKDNLHISNLPSTDGFTSILYRVGLLGTECVQPWCDINTFHVHKDCTKWCFQTYGRLEVVANCHIEELRVSKSFCVHFHVFLRLENYMS
jgi:hypothetical protein